MQHVLPTTTDRVPRNTATEVNEQIRRATEASIARCAASGPAAIDRRLRELDAEWDVERTIEANAATLGLTGLLLGVFVHRGFLVLPGIVTGFLLQHALQGWCPPVPVLRRLGRRTQGEIAQERYALKVLRGDFAGTCEPDGEGLEARADRVVQAVRV